MAEPTGKTGDAGNNPAEGGTPNPTPSASSFGDFDAFYKALPEDHRKLVDDHVSGLKSAHERVKTERTELKGQIAELQKTADPELKSKFEGLQSTLAAQEARTRFYESPAAVRFRNPVSAYATAHAGGYLNDDGSLKDSAKFEETFPELFRTPDKPPEHNPGTGRTAPDGGQPPSTASTMDNAIRTAAGRTVSTG